LNILRIVSVSRRSFLGTPDPVFSFVLATSTLPSHSSQLHGSHRIDPPWLCFFHMFHYLMNFSSNQPPLTHADPTLHSQLTVIYNFAAQSILVLCKQTARQTIIDQPCESYISSYILEKSPSAFFPNVR